MSEVRDEVWSRMMDRKKVPRTTEFKSLSPSKEAFEKNTKQAHIQTAIWKSTLSSGLPALDPVGFG